MKNLYIDIGNTNIKLKWEKNIYILPTASCVDVKTFFNKLPEQLQQIRPAQIWIASVVKKVLPLIENLCLTYFQKKATIISYQMNNEIKLQVEKPEALGVDIIALGTFANNQGQKVIVVNCGTATTITYVQNQKLKGVIIAPGLQTALEGLIHKAEGIKDLELKMPKHKTSGQNTTEAISLGIIKGNVHLINGFVQEINPQAKLILSGGNALHLKKYLPNFTYVDQATILGIEIIAKLNQKK